MTALVFAVEKINTEPAFICCGRVNHMNITIKMSVVEIRAARVSLKCPVCDAENYSKLFTSAYNPAGVKVLEYRHRAFLYRFWIITRNMHKDTTHYMVTQFLMQVHRVGPYEIRI
jgi:hypothetical protein